MAGEAADALDRRALPEAWRQGDMTLPLSYVFDPGAARDGVTVHVPLTVLPQLKPIGFDWLVPALREELVTALIRSLPKELRRSLVPVPEVVAAVLARVTPRSEPLLDALERELEALRGVRIPRAAWDLDRLPPHLRMTFRVEDDRGALVAEGNDLDALREQVRPRLRERLSAAASPLERHGLTRWDDRRPAEGRRAAGHRRVGARLPGARRRGRDGRRARARDRRGPARGDARRHAQAARAQRAVADPPRPGAPERRGRARPGARARRQPARRAGGRDGRRARGADRGGGRPGVGRGRLRAAARARRRRPGRADRGGRPRRSCGSSTPRATSSAGSSRSRAPRAAPRRATTWRASSSGSSTPASSPRPAPRGCPTSSATCAPRRGGSSGCRTRPAPDRDKLRGVQELEREYAARVESLAGRPAAAGRAARRPVAARGAARRALRPGARRARPGVGEADPARDPRRRPGLSRYCRNPSTVLGVARLGGVRVRAGRLRARRWRSRSQHWSSSTWIASSRALSAARAPCRRRRPPRASAACAPPPRATRSVASPIRQPCLDGT